MVSLGRLRNDRKTAKCLRQDFWRAARILEFRKATYRVAAAVVGCIISRVVTALKGGFALSMARCARAGRSRGTSAASRSTFWRDHLVEASKRPSENAVTNKRSNSNEAINMSDHLVEVCKSVVSGDVEPPSEHELVAEIKKLANAPTKPGETSAAAFTRLYTSQDDDGLVLRKAVQLCKRANGFPV